ncbi:MAG: hypothetical protein C0467_06010 [Planctomycetaceae bacterium]|nr:hypothetical protein [Planctomycetaceae bacterium]
MWRNGSPTETRPRSNWRPQKSPHGKRGALLMLLMLLMLLLMLLVLLLLLMLLMLLMLLLATRRGSHKGNC